MTDEKKDDVVVVEVPPVVPSKLIRATCATCGHPFVVQSPAALDAARADHDAYRVLVKALAVTEVSEVDDDT